MPALAAVQRPLIDARKRSGHVAVNSSACQSIRKPRAKGQGQEVGCQQSSVSVDRELSHKPGKVQRQAYMQAGRKIGRQRHRQRGKTESRQTDREAETGGEAGRQRGMQEV